MAKILFVCGSLNQTTQMHQISRHLEDHELYFSPYYADGLEDLAAMAGLLNFTVLGGRPRRDTINYLIRNELLIDDRGESREYDLAITCSDLIVQKNISHKRTLLVQEGITEPEGALRQLYKKMPVLPRYLANTATTGLSDAYDLFCVASPGYADHFIRKGVDPRKIRVTGIPNFDDLKKHRDNDFPYHDFVLVATTPYRESFRNEDRMAFLRSVKEKAGSRQVIFKLHPTELVSRATREIGEILPDAMVLTSGNVNDMIANAETVITQQSTCTFVALALGKPTFTYLDQNELLRLMPIQNAGSSAANIARHTRELLEETSSRRMTTERSQAAVTSLTRFPH